jgi:SAM-dependent methyltransferase
VTIRERLLSQTIVYKTFKKLVLPDHAYQRIVDSMFDADDGARVLDLGCGYGDFTRFFAGRCRYVGIDHNPGYIETARRINAGLDAEFICADVTDPVVAEKGPYDLVFLAGVLHHLSDTQVAELAGQVAPLLGRSGRFVALEPVFDPDQRLTARLIIAADRGRFVRDAAGYSRLLAAHLPAIRSEVHSDLLRMPYTHLLIEARPGNGDAEPHPSSE